MLQYEESFFIGTKDVLERPDKNNYEDVLNEIFKNNCNWNKNARHLAYSQKTLTGLVRGYNEDSCYKLPIEWVGVSIYTSQLDGKLENNEIDLVATGPSVSNVTLSLTREFRSFKKTNLVAEFAFTRHEYELDNTSSLLVNQEPVQINTGRIQVELSAKRNFGPVYIMPGLVLPYGTSGNTKNQAGLGIKGALGFTVFVTDLFRSRVAVQYKRIDQERYRTEEIGVSVLIDFISR